jgi:hypothetical protein
MQKVGYAYDYNARRILDPLTLAIALKQLSCLSGQDLPLEYAQKH